jgi:pimeloyl-ACP methyl ester carboxylesterase
MRLIMIACASVLGVVTAIAASAQTARDEEVTFRNGSITIAGTLSLPAGAGPFPAVVLLSGSGPQDRDSDLVGFKPFKLIAESFVQRGIAVLRSDDRGVGGSTGTVAGSTIEDFAGDALAAVHLLRGRAGIDAARVGLLGHSEGAIVAAVAAARSADVGFIIWMAGSAVSGGEILRMQAASIARGAGASERAVEAILGHHAAFMTALMEDAPDDKVMALGRTLAAAQMTAVPGSQSPAPGDLDAMVDRLMKQNLAILRSPWMRFFIRFDPSMALRRVSVPVLAIFGGRDLQVPEGDNRARLEKALNDAGNREVTVKVYPEANHVFMHAVTGQPAEYATLPKVFVAPLLDDLATWISRQS